MTHVITLPMISYHIRQRDGELFVTVWDKSALKHHPLEQPCDITSGGKAWHNPWIILSCLLPDETAHSFPSCHPPTHSPNIRKYFPPCLLLVFATPPLVLSPSKNMVYTLHIFSVIISHGKPLRPTNIVWTLATWRLTDVTSTFFLLYQDFGSLYPWLFSFLILTIFLCFTSGSFITWRPAGTFFFLHPYRGTDDDDQWHWSVPWYQYIRYCNFSPFSVNQ